jgi:hypothetical protein
MQHPAVDRRRRGKFLPLRAILAITERWPARLALAISPMHPTVSAMPQARAARRPGIRRHDR